MPIHKADDEGRRMKKLDSLLEYEVSEAIREECELPLGSIATVTSADVSPDVAHATIHVSVLPEDQAEEAMKILINNVYGIQQRINGRLHLKKVPKIRFMPDHSLAHAAHIEEIIAEEHEKHGHDSEGADTAE